MRGSLFLGAILLTGSISAAQFTFERTAAQPELNRLTLVNDDVNFIAGFTLTIGDIGKNFDSLTIINADSGIVPSLVTPDGVNAGVRSDLLSINFLGFELGKSIVMKADIDGDTGSQTVDWQTTLFNNGDAANAILTVTWSDGITSSLVLPDEAGRDPMIPYHVSVPHVSVPEPVSILLLALGVVSIFFRRVV